MIYIDSLYDFVLLCILCILFTYCTCNYFSKSKGEQRYLSLHGLSRHYSGLSVTQ